MTSSDSSVPAGHPAARQAAYGGHARSYDRDTGAFQPYRQAVVAALPLRQGQVVLDVGCGTGRCCGLLRDKVGLRGSVGGIEESPEMVAVARERIACQGWRNVTVVQSCAEQAQLALTADAALCCAVHDIMQSPGHQSLGSDLVIDRWPDADRWLPLTGQPPAEARPGHPGRVSPRDRR